MYTHVYTYTYTTITTHTPPTPHLQFDLHRYILNVPGATCGALELPSALARGAVALCPAAAQGAVDRSSTAGAVDS